MLYINNYFLYYSLLYKIHLKYNIRCHFPDTDPVYENHTHFKIFIQEDFVFFSFNKRGIDLNLIFCNKLYEPYVQNLCDTKGM